MRKAFPLFLICAAVVSQPGCQQKPVDDFLLFEEDYFNALFAWRPTFAVSQGFHQYDEQLEDFSRERIEQRIQELKELERRIAHIRTRPLDPTETVDAEALDYQIRAELHDLAALRRWRSNPMIYAGLATEALDVLIKRAYAPGRERLPHVIARLRSIPALLRSMRSNVTNPPREFTDLAISIARASVPFFSETIPNWARPFAGVTEMEDLTKAARIAEVAMREAAEWLERDLRPASKGEYAIGRDALLSKLECDEMVRMPLEDLLHAGQQQLARDRERFAKVAAQYAPGKSPTQVMAELSADHPSSAELLPETRKTLDRARQFVIDNELLTLPGGRRPHIAETPPFLRSGIYAAMDSPGAFETRATEAFYYITPVEPDWDEQRQSEHLRLFNRPVLDLITIHEAYPGHYVQFLHGPNLATKTRKLVSVASNAEGWAHYAEQMMIEEGYGGGDPKIELAQLSEALIRDCRFVAAIQLHTQGMPVDGAARLFATEAFLPASTAFEEARRGTYDPTYLYYTLGKLMVYKLRADFQRERGSNFTLKSFHDTFLRQGGLPLPLIRRMMLASGENEIL